MSGSDNGDGRSTLWLAGDSTVNNGDSVGRGWGERIGELLDPGRVRVENRAIGARSSRTFRTEGRWRRLLGDAHRGDVVLVQFGHNDFNAPDDPDRPRGTLAGTGDETTEIIHPQTGEPETVHTFGWYMRRYVIEACEHGLIAVLCTPVPVAPNPGGEPALRLDRYADWTREVAGSEGAPCIDLFAAIGVAYDAIEFEGPRTVKQRCFVEADDVHTSDDGALMNAMFVLDGLSGFEGESESIRRITAARLE